MSNITLIITGSVAAIKYNELINSLSINNKLTVIYTRGSEYFLNQYELTQNNLISKLYNDTNSVDDLQNIQHINLAKQTDLVIIAPASHNFINSFNIGLANTFSLSYLAAIDKRKVIIAPAMNTDMYNNQTLQNSLSNLKNLGCRIIDPIYGELACKDVGIGKMQDPYIIADIVNNITRTKSVIITCGSTKLYLDPIRYISNKSSGKFGISFANEFYRQGYKVHLIHGEDVDLTNLQLGINSYSIVNNNQLKSVINDLTPTSDLIIMAAAPIDYKYEASSQKIKSDILNLELSKDIDIIKNIVNIKKFGFALESENHLTNGLKKLNSKNLDYLLVNDVLTMNSNQVHNAILVTNEKQIKFETQSKNDFVKKIVNILN